MRRGCGVNWVWRLNFLKSSQPKQGCARPVAYLLAGSLAREACLVLVGKEPGIPCLTRTEVGGLRQVPFYCSKKRETTLEPETGFEFSKFKINLNSPVIAFFEFEKSGSKEVPSKSLSVHRPPVTTRDWLCKGADMTSAAEFEAALCQLQDDPPDIRQYNVNIREEKWTHFSLEGVRFPAMTADVIQSGEALAIFERDLIIHFQQISRAAALYIRALLGGVKRALEVYRRVDETTKNYPWSLATTEEKWHLPFTCRRDTHGRSYHIESTSGSLEKC